MIRVRDVFVYPVKSTGAVRRTVCRVERRGLVGDRCWMVVDAEGKLLTQRDHPQLALIRSEARGEGWTLRAPERPALDLQPPGGREEPIRVQVWRDTVAARTATGEADRWIAGLLGRSCRLVFLPETTVRPVDPEYAVRPDDEVSFADGYPLLLASADSLEDLNRRLEAPIPMDRFRPNLVIRGAPAWQEDRWQALRVGEVVFDVVKPCERCQVTTIDQATGERGREPLRTLASFRRIFGESVYFGWNLIPRDPGVVRVGDTAEVLESRPPEESDGAQSPPDAAEPFSPSSRDDPTPRRRNVMDLNDAKALVTGGSEGIGRGIAEALVARGSEVVITGRRGEVLRRAAEEIGCDFIQGDVGVEADAVRTVSDFVGRHGRLDVLVNNAGFGTFAPLVETSLAELEAVYRTNVFGAFLMAREAAKQFIRQGSGHLVNIASTSGLRGGRGGTAYSSSKFALRGMTECWRDELRRHDVRVTLICPSEVQTGFFSKSDRQREPSPKKLRPQEIAAAIIGVLEIDDRGFVPELSVFATNPF